MQLDENIQFTFEKRLDKKSQRDYLLRIRDKYTFNKPLNKILTKKWILGKPSNLSFAENRGKRNISNTDTEYFALLDSIIPSVNYEYKELILGDFEKECERGDGYNLKRAAFIPFTRIGRKKYWLLGSFHDYTDTEMPILTDFGGKCEILDKENECPPIQCAGRELLEESHNLLYESVLESLKIADNVAIFRGTNERAKEKIYYFIVEIPYEKIQNIPEIFNGINRDILKTQREKERRGEKKGEKYGPLGFYSQEDIKNRKYRTAKNLTDFVSYLNGYRL